MNLTKEQQEIYDGKQGATLAKVMQTLVRYGELFGADRSFGTGIVNLATMCIDYPDNEMLLDYANNLFEYQNIHVEMQYQNGKELERGQISLQHFFDGLLQESYRVKRDSNNEIW